MKLASRLYLFIVAILSVGVMAAPSLTIYNQDFAVVRDTILLDLQTGVNQVRFSETTVHVEPDSVILRDPTGKHHFQILEQNFRGDPISQGLLLNMYEGKELEFRITLDKGESKIVKGKIIRSGYVMHGQGLRRYGQQYMQSQAGQPLTQLGQQYIASDVGQPLTSLGQQYLQKSPDQVAADYISKQQALINPSRQTQLADVQNRLFQQGRTGAAVAQGGNLMATSPELAAYYNALAQQDLSLAAGANQAGQQQTQFGADLYARGLGLTSGRQTQGADLYRSGVGLTQAQQLAGADLYRSGTGLTMEGQKFGAGLFDTGAALQGKYYAGQTAAYQPFATAMDTTAGLERLAAEPLALGTSIGARTTAGSAEAGRLLSGGMTSAAATMAPANAYSLTGDVLGGAARSQVLKSAIDSAFGVQPQGGAFTDAQKAQFFDKYFSKPV